MSAEAQGSPVLSICLVNFNDAAHIAACLDSIEADAAGIAHEIIVVDNASKDGSADLVRARFLRAALLINEKNQGFGRANNAAAGRARGEFLLFVNTDVIVRPGTLPRLLAEMKENPTTGAAGPGLVNPGELFQVSFGGAVNFFTEAFRKGFLNSLRSRSLAKRRERREVGWVSGAFLLVRTQVFRAAGGFDEAIFLYFEDIDLCARIKALGWKVVYLPEAVSFHWGGAVAATAGLRSRLEYRRSQIHFYCKHNSRISLGLLRLYLRLNIAFLTVRGSLRNEPDEVREGFRDLLKNREGAPR